MQNKCMYLLNNKMRNSLHTVATDGNQHTRVGANTHTIKIILADTYQYL